MSSRSVADLEAETAVLYAEFAALCAEKQIDYLLYCTYRSFEEQARLYRKGRPFDVIEQEAIRLRKKFHREDLADLLIGVGPQYGRLVTNAAPGQSIHNYRMAFDVVPLVDGRPVWSTEQEDELALWMKLGEAGKSVGLEWGGDWPGLLDFPHFQQPGKNWRELIDPPNRKRVAPVS